MKTGGIFFVLQTAVQGPAFVASHSCTEWMVNGEW